MRRLACFLFTALVLAGCGRSELDDYREGGVPLDDVPLADAPDVVIADTPDASDVPDVPVACRPGGNCGVGRLCCGTTCTDVQGDPFNCGGCGRACAAGQACVAGRCQGGGCVGGCARGQACCGDACIDIVNDPANCGGCGLACGPNQACVAGVCQTRACRVREECLMGQDCCGNRCIDVVNDPANCGACGNLCAPGTRCEAGVCRTSTCLCPPGLACCAGDLCADLRSDRANCGACGNACAPGEFCGDGRCQTIPTCGGGPACMPGTACCGARCVNTQTDPANCGACGNACRDGQQCVAGRCTATTGCGAVPVCGRPTVCCGDRCVATQSDPFNCGGCGVACRTGESCMAGRCVTAGCGAGPACVNGQACCNGLCVDTRTDRGNCGGCSIGCFGELVCRSGLCVNPNACGGGPGCIAGSLCCNDRCVDVQNDPANCGACGRACARGQTCRQGVCASAGCGAGPACAQGSLCCNDTCVNVVSDNNNCGGCGRVCPSTTECRQARCQPREGCGGGPPCAAGQSCCAGACVTTASDPSNCGACGRACTTPPNTDVTCTRGTCSAPSCVAGFSDCNNNLRDGCEANLATDARNCGACGNACAAGLACQMGRCGMPSTGSEGAFNPRVNPTFLTPGVHNFTTINVPANVVVYVAGGGADNGVLDLRATGDVTIDGTIDVSGGPGAQSTITSRSTRQGRAGAGGFTGDPRTATPGPACEWVAGVSGGNGRGFPGSTGTCAVGSNTSCITDNDTQLIFASPAAQFGGGGGVFTGYRAYGAGGGGFAGGGPGALGAAYPGQGDCTGTTGGGGTAAGQGGSAGNDAYNGRAGTLGQTQCPGVRPGIPAAWVGGGGGGSIGAAAASDLAVISTFQPGSGGGGGSADYLNRPAFGGTSGGGGGGGALRIWLQTPITINGRVLANGGLGGDAYIGTSGMAGCDPQPGAAGGGGSGGVIFLRAPSLTVSARATVSAAGGEGGVGSIYATGGAGGAGGLGRIRISAPFARCALMGRFNPPLASGCAPTAGAGVPGRAFVADYPN